jgi:hypothetical protein
MNILSLTSEAFGRGQTAAITASLHVAEFNQLVCI